MYYNYVNLTNMTSWYWITMKYNLSMGLIYGTVFTFLNYYFVLIILNGKSMESWTDTSEPLLKYGFVLLGLCAYFYGFFGFMMGYITDVLGKKLAWMFSLASWITWLAFSIYFWRMYKIGWLIGTDGVVEILAFIVHYKSWKELYA